VEHGNSPYQNLLHVALLIKYPKAARKGREEDPVSLIDVAPTILQATGFQVPPAMQGRSLLNESPPGPREIFSETFACQVIQPRVVSWMHGAGCSCMALQVLSRFQYRQEGTLQPGNGSR